MSTPVWSIPRYNTDEDTWRQRIEAKSAENHRRWALAKAAEDAKYRKPKPKHKPTPPKPRKGQAEPCPTCGRMTRPMGARVEDYPDTIKRAKSGYCFRCNQRPQLAGERVCKYDKCNNVIPAGSYGHREYCSDTCRRRASNPPPRTDVQCKQCGKTFTRPPRSRAEYCTKACHDRKRREQKAAQMRAHYTPAGPRDVTCAHCGETFTPSPRAPQKYCQPKCRWAASRKAKRATGQEEAA